MLRPQDKRTSFIQGNNLSRKVHSQQKKTFVLASGRSVFATHIIVKAAELEEKTSIHPLNPRRQASLTLDSVRDILPSIASEGVHTEGVAVKNSDDIYLLLDSSRRRFCCLQEHKDLPLWVIEEQISAPDLIALIETTQAVKRLSYRELGHDYEQIMLENNFTKLDELASFLNIGRETCRKRYVAASISQEIIDLFPDCEGIPNSFYARLAKVDKLLKAENIGTRDVFASLERLSAPEATTVEDKQKQILLDLESMYLKGQPKKLWNTVHLANYSDKNTYAKVSRSGDKRGLKIELNRLSPELYDDIITYIKERINGDNGGCF
ncbi:chromosome partitioning protein ParB [Vibrio harveyi]|nr:chromosome partitioning protein ParB [Vibrio harveyi]